MLPADIQNKNLLDKYLRQITILQKLNIDIFNIDDHKNKTKFLIKNILIYLTNKLNAYKNRQPKRDVEDLLNYATKLLTEVIGKIKLCYFYANIEKEPFDWNEDEDEEDDDGETNYNDGTLEINIFIHGCDYVGIIYSTPKYTLQYDVITE